MSTGKKKEQRFTYVPRSVVDVALKDRKPGNLSRALKKLKRNPCKMVRDGLLSSSPYAMASMPVGERFGESRTTHEECERETPVWCVLEVESRDPLRLTLVSRLLLIREQTVRDVMDRIREPTPPEALESAAYHWRIGGIHFPISWREGISRSYFFFFAGLPDWEREWVEVERVGIEILENAADRIEEAFWHPDFPLLLKVPALGPGGWLYITRHRVLSPAAQRAANRVCKEHGWKAPFPGVSEAEQAKPGATATARERPAQKFSMKAFLKSYGKAKIQTMMFEKKHNQSVVARKMLEDAEARTREQGVSLPKTAFDYFRNHVGKTARKMGRYDFSTPPK